MIRKMIAVILCLTFLTVYASCAENGDVKITDGDNVNAAENEGPVIPDVGNDGNAETGNEQVPDIADSEVKVTGMPSDFSFSIVWGTYGISSYDSQTGKLVKTNDATDVSRYTAYVKLSEDDLRKVYNHLFSDIDITSYPETYDPFNAPDADIRYESGPNETVIITVTADGVTKMVSCTGIAFGSPDQCYCAEAKAFVDAKNSIVEIIRSLPEWTAFPDYEFYYE